MNLKENRNFLIGAAVFLALWGGFYGFGVSGNWDQYNRQLDTHKKVNGEAQKYLAKGLPIQQLEEAATKEFDAVDQGIEALRAVDFVLLSPYKGDKRKLIDFQQRLNLVHQVAAGYDLVPRDAAVQLGFRKKFQQERPVPELLRRLAVLDRVIKAATPREKRRQVKKIVSVHHPALEIVRGEGVDKHVLKVLVELEIETDEIALLHLLHHLLKSPKKTESYVGLDRIEIHVAQPQAGVFACTLSLFGIFIREGELDEGEAGEDWEEEDGGGHKALPPLPRY
jgi:hypothetical protein